MSPALAELAAAGVLGPLDVQLARTLGRLGGEQREAVLLAAALASRAVQQGHVCAELQRLAGRPLCDALGAVLGDGTWPLLEAWRAELADSPLVEFVDGESGTDGPNRATAAGEDRPARPLVLDAEDRLYLARYWDYQRRLTAALLARATEPAAHDPTALEHGLDRLFGAQPAGPTAGQRLAARLAVQRRLAVITGGPGTGKTTTVNRILALLLDQARAAGQPPPRVRLLAPTGKAAARLAAAVAGAPELEAPDREALAAGAATIHRALRPDAWQPTSFRHGAGRPLAADAVVVDEASMVDLALMTKLVEAVGPAARLLLLGDRDQLVSVEAGAILGDICPPADEATAGPLSACTARLEHSWRFGGDSPIGQLARAVNRGAADEALALLAAGGEGALGWIAVQRPEELAGALRDAVRAGFGPAVRATTPAAGLRRLERFRVLAAVRAGPFGVEGLNPLIEQLLRTEGLQPGAGAYPGRPLMVVRNDYALGLFNGDVGLTLPDGEGGLRVHFPGLARPLAPARLPPVETVFAMTAHKSQGSEFDALLLVLPPKVSPLITRELLYTAISRARRRVLICAAEPVLRAAIATPVQRASGLRRALWG